MLLRSSLHGQAMWRLMLAMAFSLAAMWAVLAVTSSAWLMVLAGALVGVLSGWYLLDQWLRPIIQSLRALQLGVDALGDNDFSVSIRKRRGHDELAQLIEAHNGLGQMLRRERQNLFQRELLLDTVIATSPVALLLEDAGGHVVMANIAARRMLNGGRPAEGMQTIQLLEEHVPGELADAVAHSRSGLFRVPGLEHDETYHLSVHAFSLNARHHRLITLRQVTREIARQEVATWKKVVRVVSHELNNSLAPIKSLAHSGRIKAQQYEDAALDRVFNTIEDRANHLQRFVKGYASVAKLPPPLPEPVKWDVFLEPIAAATGAQIDCQAKRGLFDATQMQQALLNLLKNARESGSPADEVQLQIREAEGGVVFEVLDRGEGMSAATLRQAMLPFYSTKRDGSGVGLSLCREIVDAHGGRLRLDNREGGGLRVRIWLPHVQPGADPS